MKDFFYYVGVNPTFGVILGVGSVKTFFFWSSLEVEGKLDLGSIGGQYRGTFLVQVPSDSGKKVPVPQCRYFYFSSFGRYSVLLQNLLYGNKKKQKFAQLHLRQQ